MRKLIIVQCGERKIWTKEPDLGPVEAKKAYVSNYFQMNKAYAERFGDEWILLSTKYGFIDPEEEVEDYNVHFHKRASEPITDDELKEQVEIKNLGHFNHITVLGGEAYYQRVIKAFTDVPCVIQSPLKGLKIGERMAKLKVALEDGTELS